MSIDYTTIGKNKSELFLSLPSDLFLSNKQTYNVLYKARSKIYILASNLFEKQ